MTKIDQSKIDELRELNRMSGEDILSELIILFKRDTLLLLKEMQASVDANDLTRVSELAHKIKISCAHLGVTDGSKLCLDLETVGKDKNLEYNFHETVASLNVVVDEAIVELEKIAA
ncbi:MAG: Hpt domain-containing protein [Pseudobdellovibrio sp.]